METGRSKGERNSKELEKKICSTHINTNTHARTHTFPKKNLALKKKKKKSHTYTRRKKKQTIICTENKSFITVIKTLA